MSQSQHIFSVESGAEPTGQWATTTDGKGDSLAGLGPFMPNAGQTETDLPSNQLHHEEFALPTHILGTPAWDWIPDSSSTSESSSSDTESDMNPQVLDFLKTRFIEEVQRFRAHPTGRPQRDDLYQKGIEAQDQTPEATGGSKTKGSALPSASSSSDRGNRKHGRDISEGLQTNNDRCKSRKKILKPGSGHSGKRLACLYHKYRPLVYRKNDQTGMMFDWCATHDFENMRRLFEHLARCHYENLHQCPTCGECFVNNRETFDSHIDSRTCDRKQHVKILNTSPGQIEPIKTELRKQPFGQDEEAKWRFVYKELFHVFPGSISPHMDDTDVSLFSMFEEYITDRVAELPSELPILPSRVEDLIRRFLRDFGLQHGIPGSERTPSTPPIPTPPESGSSLSDVQSSLGPVGDIPGPELHSPSVLQEPQYPMAVSAGEPSSEVIDFDTSYLDTHGTDMPRYLPPEHVPTHSASASAGEPQGSHDLQAQLDPLFLPPGEEWDVFLDNFDLDGFLQEDQTLV